jgi:endonuclease YncB( thermonuclease family)
MLNIRYKDTIPFIPPITSGKVIKVYDGDTLTIASMLPYEKSPMYRFSVRISGIDCPEIRTKNENERKCALMAKEMIIEKAMNKMVVLENKSTEKYGRILADIICDGESLGDLLLKSRLAIKYNGRTKAPPDDWLEFYLKGKESGKEEKEKGSFYKRLFKNFKIKKNETKLIIK